MSSIDRDDPPFSNTYKHYVNELDMKPIEAINSIQDYYDKFKNRNERLLERQNDNANTASIGVITQSTLLATATLTFIGVLVALSDNLVIYQKILLFIIALFEIISLALGLIDYIMTANFHNKWAKAYHDIDRKATAMVIKSTIKQVDELRMIESDFIGKMPPNSPQIITFVMVGFAIAGLFLFEILLFTYFFL